MIKCRECGELRQALFRGVCGVCLKKLLLDSNKKDLYSGLNFNNIMEIKKINATITKQAHTCLIEWQKKNNFVTIDEALDKILKNLQGEQT